MARAAVTDSRILKLKHFILQKFLSEQEINKFG